MSDEILSALNRLIEASCDMQNFCPEHTEQEKAAFWKTFEDATRNAMDVYDAHVSSSTIVDYGPQLQYRNLSGPMR